jgi:hypothetical protein
MGVLFRGVDSPSGVLHPNRSTFGRFRLTCGSISRSRDSRTATSRLGGWSSSRGVLFQSASSLEGEFTSIGTGGSGRGSGTPLRLASFSSLYLLPRGGDRVGSWTVEGPTARPESIVSSLIIRLRLVVGVGELALGVKLCS